MQKTRNEKGQFVDGHPFGKRFKRGHQPWNKYKKGYSTTKKGKKFPKFSGKKNPNWRGGKIIDKDGYVWMRKTKHPFNHNGYVKHSRLVMEEHLKRYLKPEEIVHHINENKIDDRINNLKLCKNIFEHRKYHNPHLIKI